MTWHCLIGWVALLLRCACLHSLLLESGPWPLFMLGTPTNRERKEREREREMGPKREAERGRGRARERERERDGMRPELL